MSGGEIVIVDALIKEVAEAVRVCAEASKEAQVATEREITNRAEIDARKEIVIKALDDRRAALLRFIDQSFSNRSQVIAQLGALLQSERLLEYPDLAKCVIEELVHLVSSNPLVGANELDRAGVAPAALLGRR